jgi:hypothetical protein
MSSSVEGCNVAWYPSPPAETIPVQNLKEKEGLEVDEVDVWTEINVKYTCCNKWQSIPKEKAEACRRPKPKGVEVRKLPKGHFLHGEYGLFASERFSRFDIVGEYTGKIVGDDVNGHYVAALEDKGHDDSLGIDAQHCGNEMRFINSYLNVGFKPNVTMRTAYINTIPHIVIVCCEDIEVGDEILLDYGEAYNRAYLLPKTTTVTSELSMEDVKEALPFLNSSSDEESDRD